MWIRLEDTDVLEFFVNHKAMLLDDRQALEGGGALARSAFSSVDVLSCSFGHCSALSLSLLTIFIAETEVALATSCVVCVPLSTVFSPLSAGHG